jgi:ATP-binding cassette, subfamily B, bacterial MsbA
MNLYLRILKFIKPYLPRLALAGICTVLAAAANLYLPWIVRDVVDKVLASTTTADLLNLIALGIVVIFIAARHLPTIGQNYLMSCVGAARRHRHPRCLVFQASCMRTGYPVVLRHQQDRGPS